ncbi:MAG: cytochrome c biogenesis protein CcsA [Bacteroidales bacterium]|nr:cytochrome c biogenesis protein CcsA [Bacteroidales bacterium]
MQSRTLKILSYGAMAAVIVMMVAGTVVERLHGAGAAAQAVYHHPVFIALWALLAVAGLVLLLRSGGGKRPAVLALHVAFILILAGALVTHLCGENGRIHLRVGESVAAFERSDGRTVALPFSVGLESFDIEYYPGTRRPSDYISVVRLDEERVTISMNHIGKAGGYRFYQSDYDDDGAGSILAVNHDPWGVGITYAAYLLLLLSMIAYFFEKDSAWRRTLRSLRKPREPRRKRSRWPLVLTLAGLALLALWLLKVFPKGPLMPVLRSPLLVVHVVPIIISYTLFALSAVLGVVGLLLPAAKSERLQQVERVILTPAVFLLTFGTFLGAVWANISWGNYWTWDPKETWALATLLIYAFALHGASSAVFRRPRFFHVFCILAFVAVLITYFGVNLFLGGLHSYA